MVRFTFYVLPVLPVLPHFTRSVIVTAVISVVFWIGLTVIPLTDIFQTSVDYIRAQCCISLALTDSIPMAVAASLVQSHVNCIKF